MPNSLKLVFRIEGVKGVFFGPDFIVITKHDDDSEWKLMKPEIFATIMDFFTSGLPVINADVETLTSTEIYDDDDDTVAMIKVVIFFFGFVTVCFLGVAGYSDSSDGSGGWRRHCLHGF